MLFFIFPLQTAVSIFDRDGPSFHTIYKEISFHQRLLLQLVRFLYIIIVKYLPTSTYKNIINNFNMS